MNSEYQLSVIFYCLNGLTTYDERFTLLDFDANLVHHDLKDTHLLIENARKKHVHWFIVPGSDINDSQKAKKLSQQYDGLIFFSAGVHPFATHDVPLSESTLSCVERLLSDPYCKFVGETGLDYSPGFPKRELQIPWFLSLVALACSRRLPLFLHVRDAHEDFVAALRRFGFCSGKDPPVLACVHCFTGTIDECQSYLAMGCYIGLTGFIFAVEDARLLKMLEIIGLSRLVIETDAPYMGFKGCRDSESVKRNSKYPNVPAALFQVAMRISAVSGWPIETVAKETTRNAFRFIHNK